MMRAWAVWAAKMRIAAAVHHSTADDCGCFSAVNQHCLSNILEAIVLEPVTQSASLISEAPNCSFQIIFFISLHLILCVLVCSFRQP